MKLDLYNPSLMFADDGAGAEGGAGGGGGDGGAAAAAAAAASKPWYDGADQELIGHIQTKGWHDKPANEAALAAIQAHREAERYIGVPADRIVKLPDPTDTDGMKAVWQRFGVPADPKEYDFSAVKFSDGEAPEAGFTDWLRTQAHSLNIPKDAATQLGQAFVKYLEGNDTSAAAERQAQVETEMGALTKEWGANKEGNEFIAKQGALALGVTPEEFEALKGTPGGARMLSMFHKVGVLNGDAKFVDGGKGPNPTLTVEQAVARKAELMADEGWVKRYMDGDVAANKEMLALNTIITAD